MALWREIKELNPQLDSGVRRTFERRVFQWRIENGSDKEVIFRQEKIAGVLGISDFIQVMREEWMKTAIYISLTG